MRSTRCAIIGLAAVISAVSFAAPARAESVVAFDLGEPTPEGSLARFGVSVSFQGDPAADYIDVLQIGVTGSDPALTAGDTDYSRFSFSLGPATPPSWALLQDLSGGFGVALTADLGGVDGLAPPLTGFLIGTISVDLTGLADGTYSVSLTGGPLGLNTDAGGVIDGVPVASFTEASTGGVPISLLASSSGLAPPLVSVVFGQPDGLSFKVASGSLAVPEPGGMTLFGLGFALAACARICRRRVG